METVNIMWFRRDLRLNDNAALYHALKDKNPVVPVFVFDKNILDDLEDKKDMRVEFIREALNEMNDELKKYLLMQITSNMQLIGIQKFQLY